MPQQKTAPANYPQAVIQQIEQLALNIVTTRKRRQETQAQWAARVGVSQPTMARIERGDPAVAMASYVMCMWLVNQAQGLADLIAPQNDLASLEQEVARTRRASVVRTSVNKPVVRAMSSGIDKPTSQYAKSAYLSATSKVQAEPAGIDAQLDQISEYEQSIRRAMLSQTPTFEGPLQIAAREPYLEIEKAMRGVNQVAEIEKAMRSAGLSAGMAALISGNKKPHP